jgi:hypothetical protein
MDTRQLARKVFDSVRRGQGYELLEAGRQQPGTPLGFALPCLVTPRRRLDQSLEEEARIAPFGQPRLFPRLVGVEVTARIEQRAPALEARGRLRIHRTFT